MNSPNQPTLLIVDDEPANLHLLSGHLREDYQVLASKSGAHALRRLQNTSVDLVLLDILMPEMDGYALCQAIRSDPKLRDIPLIFLTSLENSDDETRGLRLGAVDYITKPVNPEMLRARVANHLELRTAREELRRQNETLRENLHLREEIENITRHDLKSPLNALINLPTILLEDDAENLRPDQIEMLREMRQVGYDMLEMINSSLNLIKMERGTYDLEPVQVDLADLFDRIHRELYNLAHYKKTTVHLIANGRQNILSGPSCKSGSAVPPEPFLIIGEQLLCYSLFANLLKNALEASPPASDITLQLQQGNPATIAIHNFGAVPHPIRDRFFEKYATAGKSDGTGLGTYSAWLIAKTLGGTISMQTSEEQGTTLTVTLPSPQP